MKVNFVDLKRQIRLYRKEFLSAIVKVVDEASFLGGPILEQFENDFAQFCHKKYCVALNSGTDALFFALLAYDIHKGDEVITVPNSYFSTAMVISNIGAVPVFVDADHLSGEIDIAKIESVITKRTKAIMPIHLYGQPCDMDPIIALAKKYHFAIIEDCCQSHNATYKEKLVPVTETGAFSFYPGKNLGAFGDAGAIVTNNKVIYERVLHLRNDGSIKKYVHTSFGYKSRMDTIQAAVLSAKLSCLKDWSKKRRHWAKLYSSLLVNIKEIKTPIEMPYAYHVYHLYMIECEKRDGLQAYLKDHGVDTIIHYPIPIHLQTPYLALGFRSGMFPVTEKRAKSILSLPMFPELLESEVRYVCRLIHSFYS